MGAGEDEHGAARADAAARPQGVVAGRPAPKLRVACVQLNSRDDVAANVAAAVELIEQAGEAGAQLVALPETWTFKGRPEDLAAAAQAPDGPANTAAARAASRRGMWLLAGSIYEPGPDPARVYNTSALFAPDGSLCAVYRKIHLFDAVSDDAVYRESADVAAGEAVVAADLAFGPGGGTPLRAGLTVCYDLRFPELYRALALRGARLLFVPAAFTAYTGAAHWELLLRARAVENGCFVVAPDQVGEYLPGRACYGHSMIVDPWGEVLAVRPEGTGLCLADLDLSRVDEVRGQIPSLAGRRPDVYGR
jgi:deaminated glutathione amidase